MSQKKHHTTLWIMALAVCLALGASTVLAQWPQWGGPNRNFSVEASGLADKWPEGGPKKLWERELGDGYSTIVVQDGTLYTMYRNADKDEVIIALDSKSGKTLWEFKYVSATTAEMNEFGAGPHTTPLLVGDRLFTVGVNVVLHCLDRKTGSKIWSHDLMKEMEAQEPGRGYSCSPIAYKDTITIPVGGKEGAKGQSLVAFKQSDGAIAWKNQDFEITHSSPILIKLGGKDQLVVFMSKEIAGVNPENGELLWSHPHATLYGANLSNPLWAGDDLIFVSAAYDSGSRVVRLTQKDGKTVPEELWYSKKMRIHHANAVRIGDYLYGSSGDFGPAFFMGVNAKTGEIAWRDRNFAKSTCILAGGKVIILDEDGQLALATPTEKGLTIHSKCEVLKRTAWAAPTLAGKTLYVRDRKNIMALDLG
ncbi:MAG: PQQ-binding-like beta-propeller repeat protein [Planctomycetota bacterium]